MLIRDRLDAAFDNEPPPVPIERRLVAGRAALRHRRIGQGAVAVATVAVISVGSVALGGRTLDANQRIEPVTHGDPTTSSNPSPGPDNDGGPTVAAQRWPYPGELAYLDADGRLHLRAGITPVKQVPLRTSSGARADRAVQIAVAKNGQIWWLVLAREYRGDLLSSASVGPFEHFKPVAFSDYALQQQYRAGPTGPSSSDETSSSDISADERLVRFENGSLVPETGVVILEERPDPGFTNVTPADAPVAVAETRDKDGQRWFVIARGNGDGTTQNISAVPGSGDVPGDLDAFITWARAAYDSGEGLL